MSEITLCECGCGRRAPIAPKTDNTYGWTKGQPKRFIRGHNNRRHYPSLCEHEPKYAKGVCQSCFNHGYHKVYARAYPEKLSQLKQKRRARELGNGGSFTAQEWLTLKRQYGYRCVACWKHESELGALGRKLAPDHIVPLTKGGRNDILNIQPLCHGIDGCNNHKGAKYIDFVTS